VTAAEALRAKNTMKQRTASLEDMMNEYLELRRESTREDVGKFRNEKEGAS
jgi:hypothetical protein